jgi:hypothetical protein
VQQQIAPTTTQIQTGQKTGNWATPARDSIAQTKGKIQQVFASGFVQKLAIISPHPID